MNEARLRERIAGFAKSLFDRGLTSGSSGNISARIGDGWLLTPTNCCLGDLDPARISKLDAAGRLLDGDPPSKEIFLHRAYYEERASAGAIVHLHSTYSVALSTLPEIDPENALPPVTAYAIMKLGRLRLVPYYRPGDPALGDAVRGLAARHTAVLLANHGPVVAGRDLESAVYAAEELEESAKLSLLLRGLHPRLLTREQVADLEARFPVA